MKINYHFTFDDGTRKAFRVNLDPESLNVIPFATPEETVFYSASAYLLGQCLLKKQGKQADIDLVKPAGSYKGIQMVNRGMTERLRWVVGGDAVNNAVICLDMFAKELPYAIKDSLEELFSAYWKKTPIANDK